MTIYNAPVEEMMFLFDHLKDNKNYNEIEKFKEINSDLVNNDSQLFSDLDNNYTDKYFLKIQIASSSKKVPLKSYNFKGLGNLSYLKNNNTYRYYFERTQDYTLAKLMLKRAVKSGYKDALIVAFKNDKSITIEEYLSSYKK